MNSESLRIASTTAVAATRAIATKVGTTGISCHRTWAEKKVANSTATPAPSSALAVIGYLRAALSSQTTSKAIPARRPIAIRIGGLSQPWSMEYRRNETAAITSAMPAIQEKSLTPTRVSQSKAALGLTGFGGSDGGITTGLG